MSHTQSWTDESSTTPTNSSEDIDSRKTSSQEKNKRNRDLYKILSEQTVVHRWFLSDVKSLHDQDCYVQSSAFGCTGDNGLLQWAIRFHSVASAKNSQFLNEIVSTSISNTEQSKTTVEKISTPVLNHHVLKNLTQDSMTTSEEESSVDEKSHCAFEILRINVNESFSQTLFETVYQVFEVSDDGILSLLKTEGRHQVHFNRALIVLPRDTIFSVRSNNILFSVKLIIYECSSTVDYWQPMSGNNKSITGLLSDEPLLSNGDVNRFSDSNAFIEFHTGNLYWLMSTQKLFTDIVIRSSDGQEFNVHRVILCASCKKFVELIATNEETTRIEIDSISGSILERILKYIYTGDIEICVGEFSVDDVRNLINAAEVFELFQLKNILTKKCLNHITQKSCVDLLKIADDKQMKILKNRILMFLCHQFPQIFTTDLWQNFRNTRPHLYDETFTSLIRLVHLQKSIIDQLEEKKSKL